MTEQKKDLDHDQDTTESLAKSAHPDGAFMKSKELCVRCNGALRVCKRSDCPQTRRD